MRSNDRVLEVVRKFVALLAEIEPGVAVLMYEQRIGRGDVGVVLKVHYGPGPRVPAVSGDGMCW